MARLKPKGRSVTGAKVTVTLELSSLGSWGPNCTIGQVHDQAREAAIGRLNKVFKDDLANVKIIGQVVVESVTSEMEIVR